jgi:hypothetical protein
MRLFKLFPWTFVKTLFFKWTPIYMLKIIKAFDNNVEFLHIIILFYL